MIVTLYTSRVVLNALGVVDFGIYNVVGGVVSMFSMLSGSLSAAITRFITYELGKGKSQRLNKIFSSSMNIQIGLSFIILLLAETIGIWFLNIKMTIPMDRLTAANWVFQFSILTFIINLISVPYNASIIAHERMSAFAYISILEVIGRLSIAFLIIISPIDKLVFYSILMCIVALIVRFVYGVYCKHYFEECTYHWIFDRSLLKEMAGFAGWNFIGTTSSVMRDQGGNVVINLFFGPAVNAAKGIAFQVNNAVHSFVTSFMTALNPQITKSYAAGDKEYMMTLIYKGARFSFYILLILSLPVIINAHYILTLWLKVVPEHTTLFVQLVLIFAMSESISNPLITAMLATGRIRNYQIVVGGLQMLNLPISYILLRNGCIPETVLIVAICISQCCLASRLYMLRDMIGLSVREYLSKVYFNVLAVTIISSILPLFMAIKLKETFINLIYSCFVSVLVSSVVIYFIGCNCKERQFINEKVNTIIKKLK